ncbi:glycosyltransferase [Proteiniclasticum sp. QWL-01]|uniref:glycosyltransferase n=1 Tax=Proteiniclasticum sp. QWL-01 TaxID=3036945 RepID=UPI0024118CA1|nr:glycosyltransferase [Proteiniclasticum sp. QWL-01]WFF74407.1 glycosyltransferase [Proteiniclasticum sp. QWL-01]
MKVLQVNSVCGIGSTGRIATDIHNILIEQGHESYIAYGRDLPKNCDNAIRIGTRIDNYTHVAKTRVLDKHGFGSKKATIEFIDKVKELDPDIIHLHNIHGYYINVEILFDYLKEANKPVVWTLHDCWSFTGHCAYFDYVGCNKWKRGCYGCPEKKAYPSSIIYDNSKDNYRRKKEIFTGIKNLNIVTPSQWLANLVQQSFLKEYPVKVINNGIDLDVFKPTESDFMKKNNIENKFVILGVASIWDRRKGLKYFIELAKMLHEDEVIILVGLSEKQKKGLPNNIIGITRTNNVSELASIYSIADVFVNPTLEDNFPTTNLESLACGTPVITFNTGGSPESIGLNCGFSIENKSTLELFTHIQKIKGGKLIRKECLNRSKIFDKNKCINLYIKLYKLI